MHAVKADIHSGVVIEDLRSAVSNALRGRSVDHMIFEKLFYLTQRKAAIFVSLPFVVVTLLNSLGTWIQR